MDKHALRIITDRISKDLSEDLKTFFRDYKYLFNASLDDWVFHVIDSYFEGNIFTKESLQKKWRSYSIACHRTRKTLAESKKVKVTSLDQTLLDEWYYDVPPYYNYFYKYPYFGYLTDNKKAKYFGFDILDCFWAMVRECNYNIDNYYSLYPDEMVGLALFGASTSTKGEKTGIITLNGEDITVHNKFSNENATYYCIREKFAKALGPQHNDIYKFLLKKYLNNILFTEGKDPDDINRNVVLTTTDELAEVIGIAKKRYSMDRKNKMVSQLLADLSYTSYAKVETEAIGKEKYIEGVIRLIYEFDSEYLDNGSGEKQYTIIFPQNQFIQQFTNVTLLMTCNADVGDLNPKSHILISFFQKQRIELYDKGKSTDSYRIQSFRNYVRIPGRGKKAILDVIVPILEDFKEKQIFIKNYEVMDMKDMILIEYFPLTEKERRNIQLRIGE